MMIDFLTFKSFIAIDFFIFFYYMGAIVMPILFLVKRSYLLNRFKFLENFYNILKGFFSKLTKKQQIISILLFISFFLFLEIMWRICFEMVIGYFQMVQSTKELGGIY